MEEVHFNWHIPVFRSNLNSYEKIYVLEHWLRRLIYVALTAEHGKEWKGALPQEIYSKIKLRLNDTRNLSYLKIDNDLPFNEIWLTSLEETLEIINEKRLRKAIGRITKYTNKVLSREIEKIIEIRNVIAHNRVVLANTPEMIDGVLKVLSGAINNLNSYIAGSHPSTECLGKFENCITKGVKEDPIANIFEIRANQLPEKELPFLVLEESDYFYHIYCWWGATDESSLQVSRILFSLRSITDLLTAVAVNPAVFYPNLDPEDFFEHTLRFTWPKALDLDDQVRTVETIMIETRSDYLWGDCPIEEQNYLVLANPLVWLQL